MTLGSVSIKSAFAVLSGEKKEEKGPRKGEQQAEQVEQNAEQEPQQELELMAKICCQKEEPNWHPPWPTWTVIGEDIFPDVQTSIQLSQIISYSRIIMAW